MALLAQNDWPGKYTHKTLQAHACEHNANRTKSQTITNWGRAFFVTFFNVDRNVMKKTRPSLTIFIRSLAPVML